MTSITDCLLCALKISGVDHEGNSSIVNSTEFYYCDRCSYVYLTGTAASVVESRTDDEKNILSITIRNEWERSGRKISTENQKSSDDLKLIVKQFRPLDPLEKMDNALLNLKKTSNWVGQQLSINLHNDYPYYYCRNHQELRNILGILDKEGYTEAVDRNNPQTCALSAKGYQRLREIQRPNQESNQCFVAMWFGDEVKDAYAKAIMPAIEYVEPGETESRFKAVKIDNVEHVNDINDEIIAQIRRSRFMVCDLTGYRGGVYFEAGFAYGLGLPVIYTCRDDWTNADTLVDENGKEIRELYDKSGNPIRVGKEGVHFDLAHRNRIQWNPNDLDDFRVKLENRIKAVIY
jgi:hypothetical protein